MGGIEMIRDPKTMATDTMAKKKPAKNDPTSVSELLQKEMSSNSPMMRAAATKGRQFGNSRGLLNSSLAAGAGVAAAMDYALPVAQQDASQNFSRAEADRDVDRQTTLNDRQFDQTKQLTTIQNDFAKQQQDAGIAADAKLQASQYNFQSEQAELDRRQALIVQNLNLDANETANAQSMITSMHSIYASQVQGIMSNPDLTAEQRSEQIAAAQGYLDKQTVMVEDLYKINVTW